MKNAVEPMGSNFKQIKTQPGCMLKEKGQKKGSEIPRPDGILTRSEYLEKAKHELA